MLCEGHGPQQLHERCAHRQAQAGGRAREVHITARTRHPEYVHVYYEYKSPITPVSQENQKCLDLKKFEQSCQNPIVFGSSSRFGGCPQSLGIRTRHTVNQTVGIVYAQSLWTVG